MSCEKKSKVKCKETRYLTINEAGMKTLVIPKDAKINGGIIEMWGGGGGGAASFIGEEEVFLGGSGGGAGGYLRFSLPLTPGDTLTFFVGSGGNAGTFAFTSPPSISTSGGNGQETTLVYSSYASKSSLAKTFTAFGGTGGNINKSVGVGGSTNMPNSSDFKEDNGFASIGGSGSQGITGNYLVETSLPYVGFGGIGGAATSGGAGGIGAPITTTLVLPRPLTSTISNGRFPGAGGGGGSGINFYTDQIQTIVGTGGGQGANGSIVLTYFSDVPLDFSQ
jgi:hypothetical protein